MNKFSVKFAQILFRIYPSFLKIFSGIFKISPIFFQIFLEFFLQNFNKYYTKLILFSNFCCIFSTVPHSFIDTLSNVLQISQISFQKFTPSLNKITVEIRPNFYSSLLKIFFAGFRSVFKFFFLQIIFLTKLIFNNFISLNFFILCFIRLFIHENSSLFKIVPKCHKFYLKFCQV